MKKLKIIICLSAFIILNTPLLKGQSSMIMDTSSFFIIIDDYLSTINELEPYRIKDIDGSTNHFGDTKIPENIHVIRSVNCHDTLKLFFTRPHFVKEVNSYTKYAFTRNGEYFLMDSITNQFIRKLETLNPKKLIDSSFNYNEGCGIVIFNGSSIIEYQVLYLNCFTINTVRHEKITDIQRAYWPIQKYDIENDKQEVLGLTYFDKNLYNVKGKKRIHELNSKYKVDPNYRIYKNAPKKYKYGKVRKIYDCNK